MYHSISVCWGVRSQRAGCGQTRSGFISVTEQRQVVKSCACEWEVLRRSEVPCVCPRSGVSVRSCVENRVERTETINYRLASDVCHKTTIVRSRPIACRVGKFVTRSICSDSGHSTITTRTNSLSNCNCQRRVAKRSCRCRCPRPYRRLKCRRRKHIWYEVNVVFKLKNCVCITLKKVRRWRLPCRSSRTRRTRCRLQPGGDGYRFYRKTVARRYKCLCRRRVRRWKKLCSESIIDICICVLKKSNKIFFKELAHAMYSRTYFAFSVCTVNRTIQSNIYLNCHLSLLILRLCSTSKTDSQMPQKSNKDHHLHETRFTKGSMSTHSIQAQQIENW